MDVLAEVWNKRGGGFSRRLAMKGFGSGVYLRPSFFLTRGMMSSLS